MPATAKPSKSYALEHFTLSIAARLKRYMDTPEISISAVVHRKAFKFLAVRKFLGVALLFFLLELYDANVIVIMTTAMNNNIRNYIVFLCLFKNRLRIIPVPIVFTIDFNPLI